MPHDCLLEGRRLSRYERARLANVTGVTGGAFPRSYDMDRDSELELVQRVRACDPEAFDAAYALFNARLFSFLARLAGSRDVARDLLEETWLNVTRLTCNPITITM